MGRGGFFHKPPPAQSARFLDHPSMPCPPGEAEPPPSSTAVRAAGVTACIWPAVHPAFSSPIRSHCPWLPRIGETAGRRSAAARFRPPWGAMVTGSHAVEPTPSTWVAVRSGSCPPSAARRGKGGVEGGGKEARESARRGRGNGREKRGWGKGMRGEPCDRRRARARKNAREDAQGKRTERGRSKHLGARYQPPQGGLARMLRFPPLCLLQVSTARARCHSHFGTFTKKLRPLGPPFQ